MRRIKQLVLATLAAVTLGFSAPASAQTVVLVLDSGQAFAETQLGQDIARQLQELGAEIQTGLQTGGEALRSEIEDLQRQRDEFIITDEVFEQRAVELQQQQAYLQQRAAMSDQAFSFAQRRAQAAFFEAIAPDLSAIMDERGGQILMERTNTILTAEDVDVTADVIARVDGRITEMEVELLPQAPEEGQE